MTENGQGIYRLPQWQALGYDQNSIVVDPKLNENGTLKAGSPENGHTFTVDPMLGVALGIVRVSQGGRRDE